MTLAEAIAASVIACPSPSRVLTVPTAYACPVSVQLPAVTCNSLHAAHSDNTVKHGDNTVSRTCFD